MIIRARTVLTMEGEPIENGAIGVRGNRIRQVGRWPEFSPADGEEVRDLGERVLLPGLVNAHCHLDYTMLRGAIPAPVSFTGWIKAINARKDALTPADYVRAIEAGFAEAAGFGTTTVANLAAFPQLISAVRPAPLRTWWFAEMIDVRVPVSATAMLEELEKMRPARGGIGLAPHAPFTASRRLYGETAELAAARRIPATTHLAESADEMAMFRDGRGPLLEFLQMIGRPVADCGGTTPLGLMLREQRLDEHWLVAHLNELTEDDFALLEMAPRFHVVHCPRSHAYFGHAPFALEKLRALGFNICLGTDSLASNADLNLFAEMRQLRKTAPALRARAVLAMATINAAAALGQAQTLGRLGVGYLADMIALPLAGAAGEVEEAIIDGEMPVDWLMIDGEEIPLANE